MQFTGRLVFRFVPFAIIVCSAPVEIHTRLSIAYDKKKIWVSQAASAESVQRWRPRSLEEIHSTAPTIRAHLNGGRRHVTRVRPRPPILRLPMSTPVGISSTEHDVRDRAQGVQGERLIDLGFLAGDGAVRICSYPLHPLRQPRMALGLRKIGPHEVDRKNPRFLDAWQPARRRGTDRVQPVGKGPIGLNRINTPLNLLDEMQF